MDLSDFRLIRLAPETQIKPFNCGDQDLNEFLLQDARNYLNELLAVTYIIESDTETIAFFSLLNDKISLQEICSNNQWKKIQGRLHRRKGKPSKSYPAMKIGRLGVSDSVQNQGLGGMILDFIKNLFISNNRTGCKFITVDAYNRSTKFYEKNGFNFFPAKESDNHTKMMYFDLVTLF
ncbi:GNAT family N-acetyltransferase [Chitinophaga filiformis]|uniref:Acetyltransferase (GNAT) domain-containing protein n=1 Tax=Chitinophaga filiformis TaxID=104663 RepID=A0A1G7H567_CHIFI|nr:GNAT family N-acetyltransferase [Chitinophaga filiformis]SDE95453.1 Acetyltransferase (GNAT) domain-containing protein [Chitinophaga filiformis]